MEASNDETKSRQLHFHRPEAIPSNSQQLTMSSAADTTNSPESTKQPQNIQDSTVASETHPIPEVTSTTVSQQNTTKSESEQNAAPAENVNTKAQQDSEDSDPKQNQESNTKVSPLPPTEPTEAENPTEVKKKKRKYDPYAVSRTSLKMRKGANRKRKRDEHQDTEVPSLSDVSGDVGGASVTSVTAQQYDDYGNPTAEGDEYTLTKAEQDLERKRRRIEEARIKEEASKSYRERVQEFNDKASKAIDFNDIPKV